MRKYALLAVLFLASAVSAFQVTYVVDDYNSLQPIDTATIVLTNSTDMLSGITDSHGEYAFTLNGTQLYNVTVSHSGYNPYSSILNASNASTEQVYLEPNSHQGIIRLTVIDLTLGSHRSLLYFDNGRLMGTYPLNETIVLHTNMNYTWVPALQTSDLLLNKKGLERYAWNYLGIGIGVLMAASLIALFIGFLWRIMKR